MFCFFVGKKRRFQCFAFPGREYLLTKLDFRLTETERRRQQQQPQRQRSVLPFPLLAMADAQPQGDTHNNGNNAHEDVLVVVYSVHEEVIERRTCLAELPRDDSMGDFHQNFNSAFGWSGVYALYCETTDSNRHLFSNDPRLQTDMTAASSIRVRDLLVGESSRRHVSMFQIEYLILQGRQAENMMGSGENSQCDLCASLEPKSEPKEEGDKCVFCQDSMNHGDNLVMTPCGHYFHQDCGAIKWMHKKRTCPLCSANVEKQSK